MKILVSSLSTVKNSSTLKILILFSKSSFRDVPSGEETLIADIFPHELSNTFDKIVSAIKILSRGELAPLVTMENTSGLMHIEIPETFLEKVPGLIINLKLRFLESYCC